MLNNGAENNYRNRFGRLYHWRLYLSSGKKQKEEITYGADEILRPLILFKEEPMKTMKTVESRVLEILRDCPETRNEDMLLFYRYYNRFADYLRAGELPLEDLAYNYKAYGLPCFESIRRARQRVQSLFPELSRNSTDEQDGSVVIVININGG